MILGIDEVGRGVWAGPLVVGAVVLGTEIAGLTDSKALTKKRRELLNQEILGKAAGVGLGWVSAQEIDKIGLSAALVTATKQAVEQIAVPYHEIIIDGTINFLKDTTKGQYVTTLAKADLLISSVSAASIVAKVARDRYMAMQDETYPGYDFAAHVGYGTAKHRTAIERLGVTPLHRLSVAPLRQYGAGLHDTAAPDSTTTVTAKKVGDAAETAACEELVRHGYKIIARNWKTKLCEIDIIAHKDQVLYFFEVKHRKNATRGGGIEAITPKKLRKMQFAVDVYAKFEQISHQEMKLGVVTTTGMPPSFESLLVLD